MKTVTALGGRKYKAQVGDRDIESHIFPVSVQKSRATVRRVARLRQLPRTQFVQWSVSELGGKWQAGWGPSRGFPGYVIVSPASQRTSANASLADCRWYPIQVKQKDKVGRPDIDSFEAVLMREDCDKGFFVSFDYSSDALTECQSFFKRTGKVIIPLTVKEILDEEIARKLA